MRFQKQRNHHDPENGIWGDCFRTCIAIILDLEAEDVPHFLDGNPPDGDDKAKAWLWSKSIELIRVPVWGRDGNELDNVLALANLANPFLPYMLSGSSRTPANHVVVCAGAEIVCDPSLTNSGIVGPMDDGYFWLEWLVRTPDGI